MTWLWVWHTSSKKQLIRCLVLRNYIWTFFGLDALGSVITNSLLFMNLHFNLFENFHVDKSLGDWKLSVHISRVRHLFRTEFEIVMYLFASRKGYMRSAFTVQKTDY